MLNQRGIAAIATCGLLAVTSACSGNDQPSVSSGQAMTTTPSPTDATFEWPTSGNQGDAASPVPEFPEELDGWRLNHEWSDPPRAFEHTWADAAGPDFEDFPATMNGCDDQLFLVRWRAVVEDATITAGWATNHHAAEKLTPSNSGWLVLDGCQTPRWQLFDAPGRVGLSDLAVDIQQWRPAP